VPAVILPSPAQYSVSGGGSHCAGTITPHIWIMQTDPVSTGTLYFLWRIQLPNDILVATISGNGGSYDFGSQPDGSYYVTAMLPTGCTATMIGSVTVTPLPIPTVSIGHTGSLTGCGSVTTTLSTPSEVNTSYQWYKDSVAILGATSNTYTATVTNGTEVFVCVASNTYGCSNSDFVIVTANPLPTPFAVSTPNGTNFCAGTSGVVNLVGSVIGDTYGITGSATQVAGTGSTLQWNTGITTTGTFTVTATTSYGCTATMGSVYMVADPLPTAASVIAGPTSVCANSIVTYTTASILYADSCIWSVPNGATILNGQGTTSVTVQMGTVGGAVGVYGKNDCGSGQATTINVTVNQAPTLNVTANPADICAGGSTTLTATSNGTSFAWSGGGNTQSIITSPTATTTYYVTVTGSNTCTATGNVTVNVHSLPAVSLTLTEDNFCMDVNSAVISGGLPTGGAYSGTCVFGSNTIYPPVSGPGTWVITYTYTDSYGCSADATDLLTINALPVVSFYNITGQVNTDTPPFDLNGFVMPQGGTFSGAGMVGSMFNPATAGAGTHMLTYEYTHPITGCSASQIQYVTVTGISGIEDASTAGILIYPNPTDGVLNIALGDIEATDIQLFDLQGKMMYSGTETVIDLTGVPAGIYTLRITTEDGIYHSKVVKN